MGNRIGKTPCVMSSAEYFPRATVIIRLPYSRWLSAEPPPDGSTGCLWSIRGWTGTTVPS